MPVPLPARCHSEKPRGLDRRHLLRGLALAPVAVATGVSLVGCSELTGAPAPADTTPNGPVPSPGSGSQSGESALSAPPLPDAGILIDLETDLLLLGVLAQKAGRTHRGLRRQSRAITDTSRAQRQVMREARGAAEQNERRPAVVVPPSEAGTRALVARRVKVTHERMAAGAQAAQDGRNARLLASMAASLGQQEALL